MVGNIGIGGDNPIRVQTMVSTNIMDVEATVAQIMECYEAGAELIRLATQTPKHAKMLRDIKQNLSARGVKIPLVADVHYLPSAAFAALKYADKIRLNPGNFLIYPLIEGIKRKLKSWKKV